MKIPLLIFLFCLSLGTIEAILPPLYQSAEEIRSIVTSPQLRQYLSSGELILLIEKNDKGYRLVTNHSEIQVGVVYLPAERPGPAKFELTFVK